MSEEVSSVAWTDRHGAAVLVEARVRTAVRLMSKLPYHNCPAVKLVGRDDGGLSIPEDVDQARAKRRESGTASDRKH